MNKMDEVKSAALKLFATKGYSATSMQEIADIVGLNKASLYFYTKSKRDLYLMVVDEQLSILKSELVDIFNAFIDEPIDVLLYQAFKTIVFRPNPEWLLLWKRIHILAASNLDNDLSPLLREIIFQSNQCTLHFINEFIKAKSIEIDDHNLSTFVIAFDTFVHGIFDWRLLNPEADLETTVPVIWRQFWNGSRFV